MLQGQRKDLAVARHCSVEVPEASLREGDEFLIGPRGNEEIVVGGDVCHPDGTGCVASTAT
jgi:hypothetical protein